MKRPIALALTIAIFAAIAVCFLRPAAPNPDFGYVPDVVVLCKKRLVTDCTGDTYVFRAVSLSSGYSVDGYGVCFEIADPSRKLARTASRYKNGELIEEIGEREIIEHEANGKREVIARSVSDMTVMHFVVVPYSILQDGQSLALRFPNWYEPGRYTATFYMRDHYNTEPNPQSNTRGTTGDELYSISFTLATIPEASGRPFDLVSIFSDHALMELVDTEGYRSAFVISLRGGALYPIDSKIEVSKAGKWAEFESPDGAMPEKPSVHLLDAEEGINQIHFSFTHNDPTTDYRATINFAENEDGSGEQYTLTLRLKFDE